MSTAIRAAVGTSSRNRSNRFGPHSLIKKANTRHVSAGTMQAGNNAAPERVAADNKNDRRGRGRRLGRQGRWLAAHCDNYGYRSPEHSFSAAVEVTLSVDKRYRIPATDSP